MPQKKSKNFHKFLKKNINSFEKLNYHINNYYK